MDRVSGRSRVITIGLAAGAVLLAILVNVVILDLTTTMGNQSPIADDPRWYGAIATAIFAGAIPYLDMTIEHFPGALAPMAFVEGLSRLTGLSFEMLWPIAMGAVFVISVTLADNFPASFHSGRRYLILSVPLLPLVLFRIEPWLMVWVVASILLAFRGAWPTQFLVTFVASVTKGWPILLYAIPLKLGRRIFALFGGAATFLVLIAVVLLPGFRDGRSFAGIHTETIVGNIILVFRSATDSDLRLIGVAGAAYTEAGLLALIVNAVIGLPFLILSGILIHRKGSAVELIEAIGLGVMGIILASPLFSAQFIFWLVPFALLLPATLQRRYLLVSTTTLVTVIFWAPLAPEWSLIVLTRNLLLLALAVGWARDIMSRNGSEESLPISERIA